MNRRRIIIFLFIFFINIFSVNAVIDVIFQDDFEPYSSGNTIDMFNSPSETINPYTNSPSWDEILGNPDNVGTITNKEIDSLTVGGNSSDKFRFKLATDGSTVLIGGSFQQSTDRFVIVEYDVYMDLAPNSYPAGEIFYCDGTDPLDGTGTSKIAIHLSFNQSASLSGGAKNFLNYVTGQSNNIKAASVNGTEVATTIGWVVNVWYRVQVIADQVNKTFDLKVTRLDTGAVQTQSGLPFNDTSAGYIRKMWFGVTDSKPNTYFDNIYIYQDLVSPPVNGPTITLKEFSKGPIKSNTGLDVDFADANDLAYIQYKIGTDGTWTNLTSNGSTVIDLSGAVTSYTSLVWITDTDFTNMSQGENRIYFRAIDSDGSPGPYTTESSGYISFYKDTAVPNVATITTPNSPIISGLTAISGFVGDAVAGIGANVAYITIQRLDDNYYYTTTNTWTTPYNAGTHNLPTTHLASSGGNNVSWTKTTNLPALTSVNMKVTVYINDILSNGVYTGDSYTFQVLAGYPSVVINNSTIGPINTNTGMDVDFADGTDLQTIKYKVGASGTWTNLTQDGSATFDLSGGANTSITALVYLTTADFVSLSEGDNLIYFQAVDNLGNTTETSTYITYKKDSIIPSVLTLSSPLTDPFSSISIINGTVGDNSTGLGIASNSVTFKIYNETDNDYWTGSAWGVETYLPTTHSATTNNSTVNWTKNCTLPPALQMESDDYYVFYVYVTDRAGNTTSISFRTQYRDVPEIAGVTTPANGSYLNSVWSTVQGSAADRSGGAGLNADSTTFTIKRASDSAYWTGSAWGALTNLATTHSATIGSTAVPWTKNVTLPTLTDGETYYLQAKATNKNGGTLTGPVCTIVYDTSVPTIVSGVMSNDNTYLILTFSEKVWSDATRTTALMIPNTDFTRIFTQNTGGVVTDSVAQGFYADSGLTTSLSATTGYSVVYVKLTNTGGPASGVETISLTAVASQIYDRAGNVMSNAQTTGNILFKDLRYGFVTGVNTTKTNGYYRNGEVIDITVTYNASVTVNTGGGTPRLVLNTSPTAYAIYNDGTGTATLTFRYTVGASENSPDLDYVTVNSLELNGGTITQGGNNTNNTLPTVGTFAGAHAIVIDNTAPYVTSVTSTKSDGYYSSGAVIDFVVTFSENVLVNVTGGYPRLKLNSGSSVYAPYVSGGGSTTLTFRYNVGALDNTDDLDYSSVGALETNGGLMRDVALNNSNNTLPAVGTFAAARAIAIDNTAPTIVSSSCSMLPDNSAVFITFSKKVWGNNTRTAAIAPASFTVPTIVQNGGSISSATITGIYSDAACTVGLSATTGYNIVYAKLNNIGAPASGLETIKLTANTNSIYSGSGLVMANTENTGNILYIDKTKPVPPVVSGITTGRYKVSQAFTISGEALASIEYSLNGGTDWIAYVGEVTISDTPDSTNDVIARQTDVAGNMSATSATITVVIDKTAPTDPVITIDPTTPTNGDVTVTITYSGDSSVKQYKIGTDATADYTAPFIVSGNTTIYAQAQDSVGNWSGTASYSITNIDRTAPTVTDITSTETSPSKAATIPLTITFSENVTGFTADDIVVVGGTKGALGGSGSVYTIDITPSGDGTITVNIGIGTFTDIALNGNTVAATEFSIVSDRTAPTVTITGTVSPVNTVSFTATITFSEKVNGFEVGDVDVTNGTKGAFDTTDNKVWTLVITPTGDVTVDVSVSSGEATDDANNANTVSNVLRIRRDTIPPTVVLFSPTDNSSGINEIANLVITFSENVNAVAAKNIVIKRISDNSIFETIPADDVRVTGNGTNVITINPVGLFDSETEYYIFIESGAFEDAAGNGYGGISDATLWNFKVRDYIAPAIVSSETVDSNSDGFIDAIKINFSENIKDSTINASDFDVEIVDGESFVSTTFGDLADDSLIYITFTDGILNTGEVPKLNYTKGTLSDFSNNLMETALNILSTDEAPPAIWGAETADGDSDGYIDSIKIIFSESIKDISVDFGDFTINMGFGLSFNSSTNGDMANNDILYLSINDGDLSGDKIPVLSYTKGTLCDINGNLMLDIPTIASIDKVTPKTLVLSPNDDSINVSILSDISMTFSENVSAVTGKNISIHKADGTLFDTIAADDVRVTGGGSTRININIIQNFTYDETYYIMIDDGAFVDAAGNYFTGINENATWNFSVESAEKPTIVKKMAAVGSNKIYIEFDLPVKKLDGSDIIASDFVYQNNALSVNNIVSIVNISEAAAPRRKYYLILNNNLTPDNILFDKISAKVNSIYGSKNHPMDETLSYALSDYGINILNVAIYDTTHPDDSTSVKNFDGSETISSKLIKVRASIVSGAINSAVDVALMYYDAFDSMTEYAKFWRPDENTNSRQVVGRNIGGNMWEFSIPEDSAMIGKFISLVFKIKDLYSYRSVMKVAEADFDPRQITTRNVKVKEVKLQEGKVTILNNVINPNNGDVTKLTYTLDKAGPTSIVVYDLAGDVIKVLYGGFQEAGDFVVTWDGRNENSRIVARGVYFVRVRAPGIINQIRKVLVIK